MKHRLVVLMKWNFLELTLRCRPLLTVNLKLLFVSELHLTAVIQCYSTTYSSSRRSVYLMIVCTSLENIFINLSMDSLEKRSSNDDICDLLPLWVSVPHHSSMSFSRPRQHLKTDPRGLTPTAIFWWFLMTWCWASSISANILHPNWIQQEGDTK